MSFFTCTIRALALITLGFVGTLGLASGQSPFLQRVPLKLPRGTSGMQPDLALSYSPSTVNGILGVGWTLEGLPSIRRVNYGAGINYAGADTYAHSVLGVLVQQPDGTYRTKRESFMRFEKVGSSGDGPTSWTVTDRSGNKLLFGLTADARLATTGGAVRAWGLSKVQDLFGSYYDVAYINDIDGYLYPQTIRYTLGGGAAQFRSVEFAYHTNRSDKVSGEFQNAPETITRILYSIAVKANGTQLRRYSLDYECGTHGQYCANSQTGRTRLIRITERGTDDTQGPDVKAVLWNDGGTRDTRPEFNPPVPLYQRSGALNWDRGVRFADVNGDGLMDLLQGFRDESVGTELGAWLNCATSTQPGCEVSGVGWKATQAFAPPEAFAVRGTWIKGGFDYGIRIVDLNGDGLPDLLQGLGSPASWGGPILGAWINNGGNCSTKGCAWVPSPAWKNADAIFTGVGNDPATSWDGGARLLDLNGDGRIDLIRSVRLWGSNYLKAHLNTGSGWQASTSFVPPVIAAYADNTCKTGWDGGVRIADVNGDGRPDLVQGFEDGTTTLREAYLNTGSGFSATSSIQHAPPVVFSTRDATNPCGFDRGVRLVELNGDGRIDLVRAERVSGSSTKTAWTSSPSAARSSASRSAAWVLAPSWSPPTDIVERVVWAVIFGKTKWRTWERGVRFADLNGDGSDDVLVGFWDNGVETKSAWLNSFGGSGWYLHSGFTPTCQLAVMDSDFPTGTVGGCALVDANSDGRPDVLANWVNYTHQPGAWLSAGQFPDLVQKITNGIGGTVSPSYTSAALVPGAVFRDPAGVGLPNVAPRQLVTAVTTGDGQGHAYRVDFKYTDGRIVPGPVPSRRDLGFRLLEIVDAQTLQYTRTLYRQDPGLEGLSALESSYTRTGALVREVGYTWDLVSPSVGTEFARERIKIVNSYEGSVFADQLKTSTDYDAYGNPTVRTEEATALPTVVTTNEYTNDPANWILGRAWRITSTVNGAKLGQVENTWSNHVVTVKKEWLDTKAAVTPLNPWVETGMTYWSNGNLKTVTEPSTGDGLTRTTSTTYDAAFAAYPETVTNGLGHVVKRYYNGDGLETSRVDANNQETRTEYDAWGRVKKITRPDGGVTDYAYVAHGSPWSQYIETKTALDATRSIWTREYFDGSGFKYRVDRQAACGVSRVETIKDHAGRANKASLPYCVGTQSPAWTTTVFDDVGRPQYIDTPDGTGHGRQYVRGIDAGQTYKLYVSEIDRNNRATKTYYDARARVRRVVDALNQVTTYDYDGFGRLVTVTPPSGGATTLAYDTLNRRVSVTDPQTGLTKFVYADNGNLQSVTSGGKTVTFDYDALNRVTQKSPTAETPTGFDYDESEYANSTGRLTTVTDTTGITHISYDPLGRTGVVQRSVGYAGVSGSFSIGTEYNRAGMVKRLNYPDGSYADYTYLDSGELSRLDLNAVKVAEWTGYDASGRPGFVEYNNLVKTTYGYDTVGHLTSLVTQRGSAPELQKLSYDWYTRPNTGGLNVGSITDNRASKVVNGFNTDETQTYTYDDIYRLVAASGVWGTKSYGYDAGGNVSPFGGTIARTLTYDGQQVVSGTGLSGLVHDPAGRITDRVLDGQSWKYTWSAEGQLNEVYKNGSKTTEFGYDGSGFRTLKLYTPPAGTSVATVYVGNAYERRTYGDGSPQRHTINLYAHGALVAMRTLTGNVLTAMNERHWRSEAVTASMFEKGSVAGALGFARHGLLAVAGNPDVRRYGAMGLFGVFALALVLLFVQAMARQVYSARHSNIARGCAVALVLAFGLSACSDHGPSRQGYRENASAQLTGDTLLGPPPGTFYFHRNHVNSSSVITSDLGTEVSRIVYLPFGEISQPNSAGQDLAASKFTGKELDEETGLYYYGARYYDPATGRFISPDSIVQDWADLQAFNRYAYARNNPISYVDPTGHAFEFIGDAIDAMAQAGAWAADSLGRALDWTRNALKVTGQFLERSVDYAAVIIQGMGRDPMTLVGFIMALAASIAAVNPGPLIVWFAANAAAVAATSMALAAGVRNETVLGLIAVTAATAAAVAAGPGALRLPKVTEWARSYASFGANRLLQKVEGDNQSAWMSVFNSFASMAMVNAVSPGAKWVGTKWGFVDPEPGPGDLSDPEHMKKIICWDEARTKVVLQMGDTAKDTLGRGGAAMKPSPNLTPKGGVGWWAPVRQIFTFLRIFKPLNDAVDAKEFYYQKCLENYPQI